MNREDPSVLKTDSGVVDDRDRNLEDFLSLRVRLSARSLGKLQQCCSAVELAAGRLVFGIGADARLGFFLRSGVIRVWTPAQAGKNNESTRQFFRSGFIASPYSEFMKNAQVAANFSAVSAISGWTVDLRQLRELAEQDSELLAILNLIANDYIESLQQRVDVATRLDASSRLNWFYQNHRELIGVAPQSVLASYVGLTRETVNRLRPKQTDQKVVG
jgi:CRP-like cAMP-binding protein